MEIKRDAYLEQLKIRKDNGMIIALDGIENEELRDSKKCYQYIKGRKYVGSNLKYYFGMWDLEMPD